MALTPTPNGALDELARDERSRRKFLRMMGGGSAAVGLAGLLAACGGDKDTGGQATGSGVEPGPVAKTGGDIDIVNYALTLEYVEARFYREVEASGMIKRPKVRELIKKVGATEQTHVDSLEAAVKDLGGQPVSAPETAFDKVIEGGEGQILQVAATVENLGAAAYLGQAGAIESKDILAVALAIHSVEARHAAALNQLAGRPFKGGDNLAGSLPDGAFAKPMTMDEVLAAAKPFLV